MATSEQQTTEAAESRAIITVLGSDRPGIVAAVAGALSEREANILDISLELGSADFSELKGALDALSESLGVQITMQREEVFRYMYRL